MTPSSVKIGLVTLEEKVFPHQLLLKSEGLPGSVLCFSVLVPLLSHSTVMRAIKVRIC